MATEPSKPASIEMLKSVWSRRKWLAILTFVVPFVAGASLVFSLPGLYRSTVTILVERQQVPETLVRPTVTSELETRLQTISQEILSRSRLEKLIAQFALYSDLRKRVSQDEVIERMRKDIRLELRDSGAGKAPTTSRRPVSSTVAFSVSYWGKHAQTVAQVTNSLGSFYIEENLKARERQATGTADFLKVQLEQTKKNLDELERRVSEFKRQNLGELPQQMDANLMTLERLHSELRLNADGHTRAVERRDALARELADAEAASPGTAGSAAARLLKLKQELTELRTRYTERYPDVLRVKEEIAELERQRKETKAGSAEKDDLATPDPALSSRRLAVRQADAEVKSFKAGEQRIRDSIARYQRRVEETPRREQEFQELARNYKTTEELHKSLLTRYNEAQIAESMEQRQKGEQFRIIEPALPADEPTAPNRPQLFLMTLALSLALAAVAIVLAEQFDTSFHTVDDLCAFTTAPVHVTIPRIVTEADARNRTRRMRLVTVSAALGIVVLLGAVHLVARGNEQLVMLLVRSKS